VGQPDGGPDLEAGRLLPEVLRPNLKLFLHFERIGIPKASAWGGNHPGLEFVSRIEGKPDRGRRGRRGRLSDAVFGA
jgi:hypothetical protein